jgi:hypothetical protein
MRLKTCKHCRTEFKPKRDDAEFCGNLCRQAAYRARSGKTAAVRAEEVFQQKQRDALEAMWDFENYGSIAATLALYADAKNVRDVKFLGLKDGIAVLETDLGAINRAKHLFNMPSAFLEEPAPWRGYRLEESQRMASEVFANLSPAREGISFIEKECDQDGRLRPWLPLKEEHRSVWLRSQAHKGFLKLIPFHRPPWPRPGRFFLGANKWTRPEK